MRAHDNTDQGGLLSARDWYTASALLLASLLALGLTLGLDSHAHARARQRSIRVATPPQRATYSRVRHAPDTLAPNTNGCSLPAGGQSVPINLAPPTGWRLVGVIAAPSAPTTVGPQRKVDGLNFCYAHSPTGALVAAANFIAELSGKSPAAVLPALAVPDSARAEALHEAAGNGQSLTQLAGGPITLSGYQYDSYTPTQADITLALTAPNGGLISAQMNMAWQTSDWRLLVPENGVLGSGVLESLDGFTAWNAS